MGYNSHMEKPRWLTGIQQPQATEDPPQAYKHVMTWKGYEASGVKRTIREDVTSDVIAARRKMYDDLTAVAMQEGEPVEIFYAGNPHYLPAEHFLMRVDPSQTEEERISEMEKVAQEAAGILGKDRNVEKVVLYGSLLENLPLPWEINLAVITNRRLWRPIGNSHVQDTHVGFRVPVHRGFNDFYPNTEKNYFHGATVKSLIALGHDSNSSIDIAVGKWEELRSASSYTPVKPEVFPTGRYLYDRG